jgi:hypothetical protein
MRAGCQVDPGRGSLRYHRWPMTTFVQGWGFTAAALVLITGVFVVALSSLARELGYVKLLTDFLGHELAAAGDARPNASLAVERIRDEANAVRTASDPAWAQKQVRSWQMRAQRLEAALAFWVDFLRQLGLLFTVVGLGLALAVERGDVGGLLEPLGLAVWTTVAGLFFSIWLSAQFGMKVTAWADACEKNIEAWDARRRTAEAGA